MVCVLDLTQKKVAS